MTKIGAEKIIVLANSADPKSTDVAFGRNEHQKALGLTAPSALLAGDDLIE